MKARKLYSKHMLSVLVSDQPPHMSFSIEEGPISSLCTDSNDLSRRPISLQPIVYRETGSPTIAQNQSDRYNGDGVEEGGTGLHVSILLPNILLLFSDLSDDVDSEPDTGLWALASTSQGVLSRCDHQSISSNG